jgi:hypothetical protein
MANNGLHKTYKKVEMTKTALAFLHLGPWGSCGHLFRLGDAIVRFTLVIFDGSDAVISWYDVLVVEMINWRKFQPCPDLWSSPLAPKLLLVE